MGYLDDYKKTFTEKDRNRAICAAIGLPRSAVESLKLKEKKDGVYAEAFGFTKKLTKKQVQQVNKATKDPWSILFRHPNKEDEKLAELVKEVICEMDRKSYDFGFEVKSPGHDSWGGSVSFYTSHDFAEYFWDFLVNDRKVPLYYEGVRVR